MEKKEVIAVFDSGVGGLTVLQEARKLFPNESFLYYADTDNVPYGTKGRAEVITLTREAIHRILLQYKLKALILACNTATSAAAEVLRAKFSFPIIGMEPAIKPAMEDAKGKKVIAFATDFTLRERKFSDLVQRLNGKDHIVSLPAPDLVRFAESKEFQGPNIEKYLSNLVSELDLSQFGGIVLGCTHFVYFAESISGITGLPTINGNFGTAKRLQTILGANTANGPGLIFLQSGSERPTTLLTPWLSQLS